MTCVTESLFVIIHIERTKVTEEEYKIQGSVQGKHIYKHIFSFKSIFTTKNRLVSYLSVRYFE